jgi:hypothetical protein
VTAAAGDALCRDDFVRIVMDGGPLGNTVLQLARAAPPASGHRAADNELLAQLATDVVSILRSPINPFEGMLEAPTPIVRLYQAHKNAMSGLRAGRDEPLLALLRDTLGALYDGTSRLDWQAVGAAGVPRVSPEVPASVDPTENP